MRLFFVLVLFVMIITPTYSQTGTVPTGTMPPSNWNLAPNSPYINKGTDGKNPGANVDVVERAICGVKEGKVCGQVPKPATFPIVKKIYRRI